MRLAIVEAWEFHGMEMSPMQSLK